MLSRIKQKHTGKEMLGLKCRRQSKDGQLPCQEIFFQVWLEKEGEMLRCLCWYHFSDAPFCFSSWAAHSILLISALRTLLPSGHQRGGWVLASWCWLVMKCEEDSSARIPAVYFSDSAAIKAHLFPNGWSVCFQWLSELWSDRRVIKQLSLLKR